MTTVFRVLEIFRTPQRTGPILIGAVPVVSVRPGSKLALRSDPSQVVDVVAVDMPTPKALAEGRVAIVVAPDLGDHLRAGVEFDILDADD